MAADGIGRLVMVTQMKTDQANDEALHGADKQRELVKNQKLVRDRQAKLEEFVRDKSLSDEEYWAIKRMLEDTGLSIDGVDGSWDGILGYYDPGHHGEYGSWDAAIGDSTDAFEQQKGGVANDDLAHENGEKIDGIRKRFEGEMKDLEALDRLGNFEIQRLMSQYNQSEQLASSVQKKKDDTANATIGKVG